MRRFVLVSSLFLLGCTGNQPATVDPAPAPPLPETPSPTAPAPERTAAENAFLSTADGRRTQCAAGGARACLSLCEEQTKCDGKDACNRLADSIPLCTSTASPGSLCTLAADEIAPTQSSVGMFAAECRAIKITGKNTGSGNKLKRYLLERPVPAVQGPGDRFYITDRHHLSTGVLKADIEPERKNLFICAMADKRQTARSDFWTYMEANHFTWLYGDHGRKITPEQLPSHLEGLADDPYRTLSRWVRNSCGFIKCGTVCGGDGANTMDLESCETCPVSPYFLEFKWANYLRDEVPIPGIYDLQGKAQAAVLRQHLVEAMRASALPAAIDRGLPGWNAGLIETKLVQFDAEGCDE